jgi:hypothetical protein
MVADMTIKRFAHEMISFASSMPGSFDMREQVQRSCTHLFLLCREFEEKKGRSRIRRGEMAVCCCTEITRLLTSNKADRMLLVLVDFFSYRIRKVIAAERKLLKFTAHKKNHKGLSD